MRSTSASTDTPIPRLRLELGAADFQAQTRGRTAQIYAVRLGVQRGHLFRPRPRYLSLELAGPVRHRRFAFFDDSHSLLDLLALLERARRGPAIEVPVINASGLRISPVLGWKLREKLRQIRDRSVRPPRHVCGRARAAVQIGLAARIGGLETAIALAKEKIGLSAAATVELMEHPRPKLFSPALLRPRLLGLAAQPTPELNYLQFRLQHNGLPLLLVPAHHVPYGENTYE